MPGRVQLIAADGTVAAAYEGVIAAVRHAGGVWALPDEFWCCPASAGAPESGTARWRTIATGCRVAHPRAGCRPPDRYVRAMVGIRGVELSHDLSGGRAHDDPDDGDDGPDVVWGHGLTSSMASEDQLGLFDWSAIRASHRVLRYDARGHGRSGSTPEPADYSWRALADDQLALADHLGIGNYVAGGASMGCATALHAAVIAPDRVRGLVLVIPPTAWGTRAAQTGAYSVMADLVEAGDHATLLAGAAASPSPDPFVDDPRWKARFPELLQREDPTRLARIFRGAATADLPAPAEIAAIDVPTLILAWTGDPGHPVTTAARLQELVAGSELVVATTSGGLGTWTGRVRQFLDQF